MMKKFAVFITLTFFLAAGLFAQQKYALVIGNGAYANITKLNNPVNDANDMAAALHELGFTVEKVLNGNLYQMENGIVNLKNKLKGSKNSYGFLFYAGHGVQSNGENYLIPVDADISSESFLRRQSISVQEMLDELNDAGNELNVIVLDACRDNPFPWKRSGSRGLQVVGNQPTDSIIVFATSAGSTASDGSGRNGLFTGCLLERIKTPGIEVAEVFRLTMGDVIRASDNQQRPAVYNQFAGQAYLGSKPQVTIMQPSQSTTTLQSVSVPADMVRIQGGTFTMGSTANEPERDSDEVQHQVTVSSFYIGKYEVTVGEFQRFVNATEYRTEAEKDGGGYVWTGSQFEKKADANWKNPYFSQEDNHPVVLVSWNDAVQYCNWLSGQEKLTSAYTINGNNVTLNKNANGYRLPTEAEWEYACRAETTTSFNTGNNITTSQANYNGNYPYNNNAKGEYRKNTTAVGSFAPNVWGIYDMHGNVWEWCWDWYGNYSSRLQTDPLGASLRYNRVIRGGSWFNSAKDVRSANRGDGSPGYRGNYLGFRLVRP